MSPPGRPAALPQGLPIHGLEYPEQQRVISGKLLRGGHPRAPRPRFKLGGRASPLAVVYDRPAVGEHHASA
eukprot:CAMPEP_0182801244 /NCGR_PEP_ID=MMETSP0006_2-20121128/2848_1 /TAXON_ID=97485 /ORGANISM="Prymnesium parvum, Strain Texoma1" /LENGTH=70 /DNA_ID=CAMNT_0024926551 /DNA_START=314 /DNA_END=526 /DNA_ORIENTATION=-